MKNKILDIAGFVLVAYGLALVFTFSLAYIEFNTLITTFIITPLPIFIAIYLYKGVRELKHDYKVNIWAYKQVHDVNIKALDDLSKINDSHQEINGKLNVIIGEKDEEIFALEDEIGELVGYDDYEKEVKLDILKRYKLEKDEISDYDKYKNKAMENPEFKEAYDELEDIPFTHKLPYIGQQVTVKYAGEYKNTHITKILDEKVLKYRCAFCGSRKYLEEDMKILEDAPHNSI